MNINGERLRQLQVVEASVTQSLNILQKRIQEEGGDAEDLKEYEYQIRKLESLKESIDVCLRAVDKGIMDVELHINY
jgi:hypothetical protein